MNMLTNVAVTITEKMSEQRDSALFRRQDGTFICLNGNV